MSGGDPQLCRLRIGEGGLCPLVIGGENALPGEGDSDLSSPYIGGGDGDIDL